MGERVVVKIADFVKNDDNHCYVSMEAQKIFETIKSIILMGDKVTISFAGSGILMTDFLNIAIGQLFYYFDEETMRDMAKVEDIRQDDIEHLKRVVDNAKQFYYKKLNVTGSWDPDSD